MLKIQHPGTIVRDREKQVTSWEGVRTYKYSNGVECQVLIGQLPHGHVQSAITANRTLTITKDGTNANIVFGDVPATIVDFLNGDRLTAESASALVLDPCAFVPSVKIDVQYGQETGTLAADGDHLVASFGDGTKVSVEPHGNHGHVAATRDGKPLKTFFNGKDNKLYVFDAAEG
jgi:hypothetical protein